MGWGDVFAQSYGQGLDRAMRRDEADRQYALQKEAHDADMKERGLRMADLERVGAATQNLTNVYSRGVPTGEFGAASPTMMGPPDPVYRPANDAEKLNAQRGLAAATKNVTALGQLDEREIELQVARDVMDPQFIDTATRGLNLSHPSITAKDAPLDKNGNPTGPRTLTMSFVGPDGDAQFKTFSGADRQRVALGYAYIQRGRAQKGIEMLASVDRDLAARAHQDVMEQMQLAQANMQAAQAYETGRHNRATEANQRDHTRLVGQQVRQGQVQQERLEKGEKLGQLADSYYQGIRAAQGLGKDGEAAVKSYQTALQGVNSQMAGIGLRPYDPKAARGFDPVKYSEAYKNFAATMSPELAQAKADELFGGGVDYNALADSLKQASLAKAAAQGKGGKAAAGLSPEQNESQAVYNMNPEQLAAYKKWKSGEPTSPGDRKLLRQAGFAQ